MENTNYKKIALEYSSKGFNCAQAVLIPFANELGIDEKMALRCTGSFGGGVRCGEICGAILGASCAIGLKYGQDDCNDSAAKSLCSEKTKMLTTKFKNIHNNLTCFDLLGYDVNNLDTYEFQKIKQVKKEKCSKYITDCVNILEELLF